MDEQKRREAGEEEYEGYDPEAALAEEEADREKDEEIAKMQATLDEGYRASVAEALTQPPPTVVRAYAAVYGYIGVSSLVLRDVNTVIGAVFYVLITGIGMLITLFKLARRFGSEA